MKLPEYTIDEAVSRLHEIREAKRILEQEHELLKERIHQLIGERDLIETPDLILRRQKPLLRFKETGDLSEVSVAFKKFTLDQAKIGDHYRATGRVVSGCSMKKFPGILSVRATGR